MPRTSVGTESRLKKAQSVFYDDRAVWIDDPDHRDAEARQPARSGQSTSEGGAEDSEIPYQTLINFYLRECARTKKSSFSLPNGRPLCCGRACSKEYRSTAARLVKQKLRAAAAEAVRDAEAGGWPAGAAC